MSKYLKISIIAVIILAVLGGCYWYFFHNQSMNHVVQYKRVFNESGYKMAIKKIYQRDNDTVIALVKVDSPVAGSKSVGKMQQLVETQAISYRGPKNTKLEYVLFEDTKYFTLSQGENTPLLNTYQQLKTFEEEEGLSVYWEDPENSVKAQQYEIAFKESFRTSGNSISIKKIFRVGYVIYVVVDYKPVPSDMVALQVVSEVSSQNLLIDTKPDCAIMYFVVDVEGRYATEALPYEGMKGVKAEKNRKLKQFDLAFIQRITADYQKPVNSTDEFLFVMRSHAEYEAIMNHSAAIQLYSRDNKKNE